MKFHFKKSLTAFVIVQVLLLTVLFYSQTVVTAQAGRTIKILQAGSNTITLGSDSEPMPPGGYTFTVNVTLEGTTNRLYTYQVAVAFDKTKVKCTAAWIPKNDPNFVFYGKQTVEGSFKLNLDWQPGYVFLGSSLRFGDYKDVSGGILCQINFTATKTGTSALDIIIAPKSTNYPFVTFLWDDNLHDILFARESCSVSVTAMPSPPTAAFTVDPLNPKANQTVFFDASKSYDPDGNITSYVWDFGDGTNQTTTLTNATHAFVQNGLYPVNLTVFDNDGQSNSLMKKVLVGVLPYVNFTYEPTEIGVTTVVTFNASRSFDPDPSRIITSYVWDFGDGTNATEVNATDPDIPEPWIIQYVFGLKGVFWVNLTVYNNEGLYNSTIQELIVGKRPIAFFTFSPENPSVNQTVTFDASLSSPGEAVDYLVLYVWDFGDYSELGEMNATDPSIPEPWKIDHAYLIQGGVYPVNLTVYDNNGLYSSVTEKISVEVIQKPFTGADNTIYIAAGVTIVVIIVAAVFLKRRQKPELARKERYRVI